MQFSNSIRGSFGGLGRAEQAEITSGWEEGVGRPFLFCWIHFGFHFWPLCWGTSCSLAHTAPEAVSRKSDGSRTCFPTHLWEKQTERQHKESAGRTWGRKTERQTRADASSHFVAGSTQRSHSETNVPVTSMIPACKAKQSKPA